MRLLITADIHAGKPEKLDDCIWALDIMRQYAEKHGIKHVIICGDLFHDRENINIKVLQNVYDALKRAVNDGQEWYLFPGNHDMNLKNSWDITSIHALGDLIHIWEDVAHFTIDGQRFWVLPFIHYETVYMERLAEINKQANENDILLTHIGVSGATMNVCFQFTNWNIVSFEGTKFKRVYVGHFHCQQQVGTKAWYPGSPIPFKFDEGDVDHGFFVYDTKTNQHEFIKIFEIYQEFSEYRPPDYVTIVDENIAEHILMVPNNNIRVMLCKEYTNDELTKIRTVLTKKGAQSVNWLIQRREMEELRAISDVSKVQNSEDLFIAWLKHDQPKDLIEELLLKLHQRVANKADERYNVEVSEEDAAA